ncbi:MULTISPECIES: DUF6600 domain-containing protein [Dyella]|uniref:FecR protein domain-containing protein n=2 Tax=Dyella TaxID=231454 RepID=A0A4R0YHS6_9GAMM|nr:MULTISPECIES: DUF6600 domain-containing protein [Dyella]TBR36927.1 hypothetical protein EYV96_13590 [Dyella terrae]TCI07982.1 hypothetical protein EZM97_25280 [Dyella soli]
MRSLHRSNRRPWSLFAATLLLLAAGWLHAQDAAPDDGDSAGDPPSRVARLSYRTGDLGLLPSGAKDWSDANLNRPLTTGDRLSSGDHAKAELELGGSSLRMAAQTDLGVLTLNDQMAQFELTQGTANLAVRNLEEGQTFEIDTPTVALVVDRPGTYRVDIAPDGKGTQVTVFRGQATVYGENNAQRTVVAGTHYQFDDSSLQQVSLTNMDGGDAFDDWCSSRDQRYAQSNTRQYVPEDMVGSQDLDQYGDWRQDPEYGAVWYPSDVATDWAPYRDGHWAYVAPWGWTWVDDSPWGFAPYHYGRWAYVRGSWGWVPGPIGIRPVYAPALVAFVGGSGWSVSVGIGGSPVGWFPLGPGEVYNPWYHASRRYYTNVNVTNIYVHNRVTVINNINHQYDYFRRGQMAPNMRYANRGAPRGFTAMQGRDFADARNVRGHMWQGNSRDVANVPVLPRGANVTPTRASFAPPRSAQARPLPAGGFQREVVARNAPQNPGWHQQGNNGNGPRFGGMPRQANAATPAAPSNVRVLGQNGHRGGPDVGRDGPQPAMRNPASAADNRPGFDRANDNRPGPDRGNDNRPAFQRGDAQVRTVQPEQGDRPMPDRGNPDQPGELRSSRFAHPNGADRGNWRTSSDRQPQGDNPRPGVSYISTPQQDRERAAQQQVQEQPRGTLPDTPRFNRDASPRDNQPSPQPRFRTDEGRDGAVVANRPDASAWRNRGNDNPQPRADSDQPQVRSEPQRQNWQRPEPQPRQERQNWQPQRQPEQARMEQPRQPPQPQQPQPQRQAPQGNGSERQAHNPPPRGDDHRNKRDDHN